MMVQNIFFQDGTGGHLGFGSLVSFTVSLRGSLSLNLCNNIRVMVADSQIYQKQGVWVLWWKMTLTFFFQDGAGGHLGFYSLTSFMRGYIQASWCFPMARDP